MWCIGGLIIAVSLDDNNEKLSEVARVLPNRENM